MRGSVIWEDRGVAWRLLCFAVVALAAVLNSRAQAVTESPAISKAYLLAPSDLVQIKVFQEDDLTTSVRIAPEGTVTFPLLGDIRLAGKTVDEAREFIRTALARDYLVNPQVTVNVIEYAKHTFTILGQVKTAGSYEIPPPNQSITLIDAIAKAGGASPLANLRKVIVKRQITGKVQTFDLDVNAMMRDRNTKVFEVLAGDTIEVRESGF